MTFVKLQRIVDRDDWGELQVCKKSYSHLAFLNCGLSCGKGKRSLFEDCVFENIRTEKCVLGAAQFIRCVFKDIYVADFLHTYRAGFGACVFKGQIRTANIGILPDDIPRLFYWQNKRLAKKHRFAIDVTGATLDEVCFEGHQIVPYVRFRPGQCLIVRSKKLYAICEHLREETWESDIDFSSMCISCATDKKQREALLVVPPSSEHKAAEYAARLRDEEIEVIEEPLC